MTLTSLIFFDGKRAYSSFKKKKKILFGMVVNSKISRLHWYPHTCAHPHTHTHTHTHLHMHTHAHTHKHVHAHTHTHRIENTEYYSSYDEKLQCQLAHVWTKKNIIAINTHTHTHLPCMTSCCPRHVGDHLCLETVSFFRRQTKRLPWTMAATKSARSVSMKAWESVQVHLYIKPH